MSFNLIDAEDEIDYPAPRSLRIFRAFSPQAGHLFSETAQPHVSHQ